MTQEAGMKQNETTPAATGAVMGAKSALIPAATFTPEVKAALINHARVLAQHVRAYGRSE